ncbi:hypothetical protein ACWOFR_05445 [Carnobacterium gallinarum]|uniref:hypothetical protein n=1 Tax=Carnobacterium gallinarum TaxID=2749 RepID=UPI000552000C|nr:hypothetical protein [Carnobacterium gallinarum]
MKKKILTLSAIILTIMIGIYFFNYFKTEPQINYSVREFPKKYEHVKNNTWFPIDKENIVLKVVEANGVKSINFLNSRTFELAGKDMSSEINIDLGQTDLAIKLETFILDIKLSNSNQLKISFINDGIKIDSDNLNGFKFALIPNSRSNEFRVNPAKKVEYDFFEIKTSEKSIFIKSSHFKKDSKGNTVFNVYSNTDMKNLIKEVAPE